jgi:hypothetical protein
MPQVAAKHGAPYVCPNVAHIRLHVAQAQIISLNCLHRSLNVIFKLLPLRTLRLVTELPCSWNASALL